MTPSPPVVILAAGEGARLRPLRGKKPKPLVELLGVPLIQRVLRSAREAGFREFYVVTGFRAEEVEEALRGEAVRCVRNPDWKKGNATSVLAVEGSVEGPFVVLMADHLLPVELLSRVREAAPPAEGARILADTAIRRIADLKEATKVRLEGNRVTEIGKELPRFDAVDAGVFYCTAEVFSAMRESLARGDGSLTGGMRVLAEKGKLTADVVHDGRWVDVDSPKTFRAAERRLLKGLAKKTDGPVCKYLNRPFSAYLSGWLARWHVHPNTITIASTLLGLFTGAVLAIGGRTAEIVGGILTQLTSVVDGMDGEVARLTGRISAYGGWLDSVLDRYVDAAILLGAGYGIARTTGDWSAVLWAFAAMVGGFMNSYTAVKYDEFIRKGKIQTRFRFGRDTRLFLLALGGILGALRGVMILLAIITNAVSLYRIVSMRKWMEGET